MARRLAKLAAGLAGAAVLLVAALLGLANVPPGQRLIAGAVDRLSGGSVVIGGLSSALPWRLRAERVELRDAQGTWLAIGDLALDWQPWRLLAGEVHIRALRAATVALPRLAASPPGPATTPGPATPSGAGGGFALPVRVVLDRLQVGRLTLGAPVAGAAAVLAVDGAARLDSLWQGEGELTLRRLDGGGRYHLAGRLDAAAIDATLSVSEPAQGILARLAGLPDLGATTATLTLAGPFGAAAARLAIAAGPLQATAQGRLDLPGERGSLDVTAVAPAMAPRADLSWQAVRLAAHVQGALAAPDATGHLAIDGLHAGGAVVARIAADLSGNLGQLRMQATAGGIVLPGPRPDLLAAAPVALVAAVRLDQPARPVTFAISHPLLRISGEADTAAPPGVGSGTASGRAAGAALGEASGAGLATPAGTASGGAAGAASRGAPGAGLASSAGTAPNARPGPGPGPQPATASAAAPHVSQGDGSGGDGSGGDGSGIALHATLSLPDLAPLAAVAGVDIAGRAELAVQAASDAAGDRLAVQGTLGLTAGPGPAAVLVGPDAQINLAASRRGGALTLDDFSLDGRFARLAVSGRDNAGRLDIAWQAALGELAQVAPGIGVAGLEGSVQARGHVTGALDDLAAQADISGDIGAAGVPRGPVSLSLAATGLPARPQGRLTAQGRLLGAPLVLAAELARAADGTLHADIRAADWKSVHAEAALSLAPGAALPLGTLSLAMGRLDELAPLLGQAVRGSLAARVELAADRAVLSADIAGIGLEADTVARVHLAATVDHPLGQPEAAASLTAASRTAASLTVSGIDAFGVTGSASLRAEGPQQALALRLATQLTGLAGAEAHATAAATLDLPARRLALAALDADWRGEALHLLAPVRVAFADGVSLDRLQLALGTARLDLAGRLTPRLAATLALRGVTPELAAPFLPGLAADGMLRADATLSGTLAHPGGTVQVAAEGVRLRSGPGRGLPAASLAATAVLAGDAATVEALLAAGQATRLTLAGRIPFGTAAGLDLRVAGGLDLAMLNPILSQQGRQVAGRIAVHGRVSGGVSAPAVAGTVQLDGGAVQDFADGVQLGAITARIEADGPSLRISRFTATAGGGTVGLAGSVGVLAPGMPVDLTLSLQHAQPLSSDRLTATLDGALSLRGDLAGPAGAGPAELQEAAQPAGLAAHPAGRPDGEAPALRADAAAPAGRLAAGSIAGRLAAAGHITIDTAAIRIPDSLPPGIAVLAVRRPGQVPPPPAAMLPVGLDVTVASPGRLYVRGHGLDAELGGRVHLGGTLADLRTAGGFQLRRGTFAAAGTTLTFSKGTIGFDGADATDPSIDFEATSTANSVTATLAITGSASAPKLTLSSSPPLPQDEVLSYLLFRTSTAQISAFQAVEIAQTLASFTGVGGGLADPLAAVRSRLGLDRLTLGGGTSGSAPTLEAGRYVAPGVYVGATQSTSGTETQAQVQIDITRGLKLQTGVGTGRGGSSVGLTYQFEY